MYNVTGERDFFKFYFSLIGFWLIFLIMSFLSTGIFISDYHSDHFQNKEYGMLVMSIALIALGVYVTYRFYIVGPTIFIDHNFIKLNQKIYYWTDLEEVQLSGKRPYVLGNLKEGVLLSFKENGEIYFLDMYSNTASLKHFIQYYIVEKNPLPSIVTQSVNLRIANVESSVQDINGSDITVNNTGFINPVVEIPTKMEIETEQFVTYKNSQFFNFRSFMLWLYLIGIFYTGVTHINKPGLFLFLMLFCYGIFRLLTWFTNYFKLSDSFLIIKNHNSFWRNKYYRLSDIAEIIFEEEYKMPGAIRITTKDFDTKRFLGATLWKKQWRALRDDLMLKGVPIKDEFIFEKVEYEFVVFEELGWTKKKER